MSNLSLKMCNDVLFCKRQDPYSLEIFCSVYNAWMWQRLGTTDRRVITRLNDYNNCSG